MRARVRQHRLPGLIKRLVAVVLLSGTLGAAAGAAEPGPREVIEGVNAALLEVMQQAEELGYAGRYQRLQPVLEASFDFPFMIRIAVGRAWRDLTEAERAELTQRFSEMSIASFAARFDGYSGERFEIVGEGPAPRDAVLIESRIVRPADAPVGLNYVLKPLEGRWRIIDILLDAKYSELARQRAEFGAVLKKGGLPALMATLEQKINELSGGG